MIAQCFLTLAGVIALQSAGSANLLKADDEQTCIELCKNCEGTATFQDNVCQCHVADDNQRGTECIGRIKRQAGELGLDVVSCDLADSDADRAARCILSPFRRFKSRDDADLIAKYFMGNGFGNLGSLLGSSKSKKGEATSATEDSKSSSTAENIGSTMQSCGSESHSDPALVGASNPVDGANPMPGQLMEINPLLGAAPAWLQPYTLLAIGNGMQGPGAQGYVGQPGSISSSTNHNYGVNSAQSNFVGSSHQNSVGDYSSMGTHESYSPYPAGTIVGMAPYSYVVGSTNPALIQDGSQVLPMQSYLYSYNSMVGAQNPSFMGGNHLGSAAFCNHPASIVGASNPQHPDLTAAPDSSLDEGAKVAQELVGEPDPDLSLQAEKGTDYQDNVDELENVTNEITEPVVGSKQTGKDSKKDAVNLKKIKDQTIRSANHNTRRRQSRFRSQGNDAKPDTMTEGTSGTV